MTDTARVLVASERRRPLAAWSRCCETPRRPSSIDEAIAASERLREPSESLLRSLDRHGPAMLEFRDDGTAPRRIKINGRFWGPLQLAISAGVDFPSDWVSLLRGGRVEPRASYREDVIVRRVWGDVKRLLHLARGTRHETWDREDPWPAVAEPVEGVARELLPRILPRRGGRPASPRIH